jgi:hypothetical protein
LNHLGTLDRQLLELVAQPAREFGLAAMALPVFVYTISGAPVHYGPLRRPLRREGRRVE